VPTKSPDALPPQIVELKERLAKLEKAAKKDTAAENEPLLQVCVFGTPFNGRLLVQQQKENELAEHSELLQRSLDRFKDRREARSLLMWLTTLRPLINLADFRTSKNLGTYQSQEFYGEVEVARRRMHYTRDLSPEIKEVCVEVIRNERDVVYLAPTGKACWICIIFHCTHIMFKQPLNTYYISTQI
jgi:hypothetical protein